MQYASVGRRFLSHMIDSFIIVFLFASMAERFHMPIHNIDALFNEIYFAEDGSIRYLMFVAIASILSWLYITLMESSPLQGTFGKHLVGIKVTDLKGKRLSFKRANARFWSKILIVFILTFLATFTSAVAVFIHPFLAIPVVMLVFYFGFFFMALNPKKQDLHDLLAKCVVLKIQK